MIFNLKKDDMPTSFEAWGNFKADPMEHLFDADLYHFTSTPSPAQSPSLRTTGDVLAQAYVFSREVALRSTNDVFRRRIMALFWWDVWCMLRNGICVTQCKVEGMLDCIRTVLSGDGSLDSMTARWSLSVTSVLGWIKAGRNWRRFVDAFSERVTADVTDPALGMHVGVLFFLPEITDAYLVNNWSDSGEGHDLAVGWLRDELGLVEAAERSGADLFARRVRRELSEGFRDGVWFRNRM